MNITDVLETVKDLKNLSYLQITSIAASTVGAGILTYSQSSTHDIMYTVLASVAFFCAAVHQTMSSSPSDTKVQEAIKTQPTIEAAGEAQIKKDLTTHTTETTDEVLDKYIQSETRK